ncbi:MAG TPA: MgtC/SapB family protein [Vicinamibacteria bacterium]|nr:MgtC/SapB family protein [Vicinamibacteria bacterium]
MTPSLELQAELLSRLVIAAVLGAVLGYERARGGKPVGARTQGLVSLGAALFTLVSVHGFDGADPSRVGAQIVTGIGFLAAGLILQQRRRVRGLTTAASLWVTAAIGMAVGVGWIALSIAATALVFLLLRFGPRPRRRAQAPQTDGRT